MASTRKGKAEQVAAAMIGSFLHNGQFEDIDRSRGTAEAVVPAGAIDEVFTQTGEEFGFHGLAVRCVGYAEAHKEVLARTGDEEPNDVEAEHEVDVPPTCYLYVTRSSKKLERALPATVGEVAVKIRKVGRVQVRPEAAAATTNKGNLYRVGSRIACGSSIGPAKEISAGTMGALVFDKDKNLFVLTNNHVIGGCNHTPKDWPITAPGQLDVAINQPPIPFARFHSLVELRSGDASFVPTQKVDVALAAVDDDKKVTSRQGTFFETPTTTKVPVPGDRVEKVGRTTGHTVGIVEARVPAPLVLPYTARHFTASVNYGYVYTVRGINGPFALPGDSGSLVVTEDHNHAVGLVFAVANKGEVTWMSSIQDVLTSLTGIQLASGV